ncbi:Hsp70 family protein [Chloroflexota bacterium]
MERSTIDFGIDLGTTNSCIAVLEGTLPRIIRTMGRTEITPSAVSFDAKGRQFVGEWAKSQHKSADAIESADVSVEFKLSMGHTEPFHTFQINGKQMMPEELSAEVLKLLKSDVQREMSEEIFASAISVPAGFETPQNAATDRAAKLAGLSISPLLQEPVAAALAYGFQTKSDRVFWMVYDFGGGTFDVAIVQVRDEQIQVVNHGGDTHLGGKLIDWEIVNQLLIPAMKKEYKLEPDDIRWEAIGRHLKLYAEEAKIRLSSVGETDLLIRDLFLDASSVSPFEYTLKRSDIERIAEPLIERSINKCKAVFEEKRLAPSDIEKTILVGGPTLTPIFREMLLEKIGIPLEFREDPMTVVARGAAIFAGTQIIPEKLKHPVSLSEGQFKLELDYQPIGDEEEPAVGGKIIATEEQTFQDYTIEFVESKTKWRSGKININENGAFMATIYAGRDCKNEFLIELRDSNGNLHETVPNHFSYTIGITISAQLLVNDVGIALANGETLCFLKKNDPLPAKRREANLKTSQTIRGGDSGTLLRIPVVEGTNMRADRNHLVGYLKVSGQNLSKDVPIGSDVEITLIMDESRLVHVSAYVPILDEEFERELDPKYPLIIKEDVEVLVEKTKERLNEIDEKVQAVGSTRAEELLEQIEKEGLITEINASFISIQEQEGLDRRERRRIELDVKLDDIEDLIAWPALVVKAETEILEGQQLVKDYGDSQDKKDFSRLEEEIQKAITSNSPEFLQQKINSLSQLIMEVLIKQPAFWVAQLERLDGEHKENMRDQTEAERLIALGYRAINNQDVEGLQSAVRQLWGLLPDAIAEDLRGYRSTIMKEGF